LARHTAADVTPFPVEAEALDKAKESPGVSRAITGWAVATVLAELTLSGKNLRRARSLAARVLREPPRILQA
jgi:hypothetical protein